MKTMLLAAASTLIFAAAANAADASGGFQSISPTPTDSTSQTTPSASNNPFLKNTADLTQLVQLMQKLAAIQRKEALAEAEGKQKGMLEAAMLIESQANSVKQAATQAEQQQLLASLASMLGTGSSISQIAAKSAAQQQIMQALMQQLAQMQKGVLPSAGAAGSSELAKIAKEQDEIALMLKKLSAAPKKEQAAALPQIQKAIALTSQQLLALQMSLARDPKAAQAFRPLDAREQALIALFRSIQNGSNPSSQISQSAADALKSKLDEINKQHDDIRAKQKALGSMTVQQKQQLLQSLKQQLAGSGQLLQGVNQMIAAQKQTDGMAAEAMSARDAALAQYMKANIDRANDLQKSQMDLIQAIETMLQSLQQQQNSTIKSVIKG